MTIGELKKHLAQSPLGDSSEIGSLFSSAPEYAQGFDGFQVVALANGRMMAVLVYSKHSDSHEVK